MTRSFGLLAIAALSLGMSGCATKLLPSKANNPPPQTQFSAYKSFELRNVEVADTATDASEAGIKKIRETMIAQVGPLVQQWNQNPQPGAKGTLVIEPRILGLKFVNGAQRFFVGAMAGSSAVKMELVVKEAGTGREIARPEIYRRSNAYAGALGIADNKMLSQISQDVALYLSQNYSAKLGGPVER